jgi:hypothetical protein
MRTDSIRFIRLIGLGGRTTGADCEGGRQIWVSLEGTVARRITKGGSRWEDGCRRRRQDIDNRWNNRDTAPACLDGPSRAGRGDGDLMFAALLLLPRLKWTRLVLCCAV